MSEWSETSAFWIFNQMSNWAYTKYNYIHPEIRKVQREFETKCVEKLVPDLDERVSAIKGHDGMVLEMTRFSCNTANELCAMWKDLYHTLFMKYMDGNLNTAQPLKPGSKYTPIKSEHPKYSDEYYEILIEKTGDKLKAY